MEYYLRRTSKHVFRVAKFDGTVAPVREYWVEYYFRVKPAKCDCWHKRNCLHIRMVDEWYHLGCPLGGYYYWPETEDHDEAIEFMRYPYTNGWYFDAKGQPTR